MTLLPQPSYDAHYTACMSAPTATPLYNVSIEANALAILLKFPEVWSEFDLVNRLDFSEVNRPVYEIIKIQLSSTPAGNVDPLLLSERMRAAGKSQLPGGVDCYPYLDGLLNRFVERTEASNYARELKRLTVRRELIDRMDAAKHELLTRGDASFEQMTNVVEKELTSITTEYHKPDVIEVMGDNLISTVEDRAANPIKPEDMLYMGPFDSINRTMGPAIFPGSLSLIIARTGVGKSSLSFYWCVYVAEKYGLPLLWLDAAEMTVEQLQMRAVCCLSNGRVPLWAVRSGEWDKNPTWRKIVRDQVWPRVKKIQMVYKNVGALSPREKIAFIKRYYYNKVGRDRFLIIGDDYLKGVEAIGTKSAEWQAMGYYIGDVKTLITDEIQAGYWSSLQGNRSIITQGKKASEIVDSGETGASISDRIIQQATTAWLMRYKVPEEMAREKELFGNVVLKKAKLREGYGRDYEKISRLVKLDNGALVENYWHLYAQNFHFMDRGLHSEALQTLGKGVVNLGKPAAGGNSSVPPVDAL